MVLTGSKTWITNSPLADILIVWARADADNGALRGFLVDRAAVDRVQPGALATPEIEGKLSLRASTTGSILLDGVRVAEADMLPHARGFGGPFACRTARPRHQLGRDGRGGGVRRRGAAVHAGAHAVWRAARRAARAEEARRRGHRVGLGLHAALAVGRAKERGESAAEAVSLVKRNSCGKALEIARACRDMLGGNGISDEFHVMRHMVNLETVNTYEGTHDIHALILGRAITGVGAFKAGAAYEGVRLRK